MQVERQHHQLEQQKQLSLSAQLFQAYTSATVLSVEQEAEHQQLQKSTVDNYDGLSLEVDDKALVKNEGVGSGDSGRTEKQKGAGVDDSEIYNLNKAIQAWDKIGEITSEIAYSAMVKQAQIVCEFAKRDDRIRKQVNEEYFVDDHNVGPKKRRKVHHSSSTLDNAARGNVVVSSSDDDQTNQYHHNHHNYGDNESESTYEESNVEEEEGTASGMSSLSAPEDTVYDDIVLSSQVERMGRMTKYMADIENLFSKFRGEMEGINVISTSVVREEVEVNQLS